jgi:hypothetical protein
MMPPDLLCSVRRWLRGSAAGLVLVLASAALADAQWREIEPGLALGTFAAPPATSASDGAGIHVLRIQPERFELRLLNASGSTEGRSLTARAWAERHGLVAAINASMYQTDRRTSVSLMRSPAHVNNPHLSKDMTVLAFGPKRPGLAPVALIDRECDNWEQLLGDYETAVQSIRMVSCRGRNVWAPQPKRWSTAAIGIDRAGRPLLIHVRSPYSVHDLIGILTILPLDLARAMYVEGGVESQLYVRAGSDDLEFVGSFEGAFGDTGGNSRAWPIPNVIGVARRTQ